MFRQLTSFFSCIDHVLKASEITLFCKLRSTFSCQKLRYNWPRNYNPEWLGHKKRVKSIKTLWARPQMYFEKPPNLIIENLIEIHKFDFAKDSIFFTWNRFILNNVELVKLFRIWITTDKTFVKSLGISQKTKTNVSLLSFSSQKRKKEK